MVSPLSILDYQLRGVIRNETGIEEWILYKARARHARMKISKLEAERERQERAAAAAAEQNGRPPRESPKKKPKKAKELIPEGSREFHDCFPNPFRVRASTLCDSRIDPTFALSTFKSRVHYILLYI